MSIRQRKTIHFHGCDPCVNERGLSLWSVQRWHDRSDWDGNRDADGERTPLVGVVAPVRLAEAHVTVAVALDHARVVDDEVVHLEVVRARPADLIVLWKR